MDGKQAVGIIKEISEQRPYLEEKSIKLLPPKDDDLLSNTFQVHTQTWDDFDPILVSLEAITEKHNLAAKQVDGYQIVNKTYQNK